MEGLIGFAILIICFLFLGAFLGIISFSRVKKLKNELNTLQKTVRVLQSHAVLKETVIKDKIDTVTSSVKTHILAKQVQIKKEEHAGEKKIPPDVEKKETEKQTVDEKEKTPVTQPIRESKQGELFKGFEKSFLENWTGIMGALIIVLGIAFLGIFAALKLSEMHRFFMIAGISIVFLIVSFLLRASKKWVKLGLWVRSIAAALFLLACAGAGGIPGLNWIDDPFAGLMVLCLGIAANILLAVVGGKQVVASVHLLLSLTSLAIAPQSQVIFVIATIVTLSGIILTFREKWEYHLLLTTTLYCIYFVFFYFAVEPLSMEMKITCITGIPIVSILALFVHYRKIYKHPSFDVKPFLTHLFTWIYFGIGLFLYSPRVSWISLPLGAGACLCFLFAHRARALKIRWLFNTDILMSQVIAIIAIITLLEWNVPYGPIVCILIVESLVFTSIVLIEGEDLLYHCGQWFFYLFSFLLFILSFIGLTGKDTTVLFRNSLLLSICIIAALFFHIFSNPFLKKRIMKAANDHGKRFINAHKILCGLITGLFFIPLYFNLRHHLPWMNYIDAEYLLLIPLCVVIFIREKIQSKGLGVSVFLTLIVMHILVWRNPILTEQSLWYEKLIYSLPLFILDLACMIFTFVKPLNRHLKWPGIYLFSAHLFGITFYVFNPLSPLIPGVAWLCLSVVMLEISRFFRWKYGDEHLKIVQSGFNLVEQGAEKESPSRLKFQGFPDAHFLNAGYAYIAAFLIFGYILVHLQSEQTIWIIKARQLIEVFAILVFLYWGLSKKPGSKKIYRSYIFLHPLFPELISIFAVLVVTVEVKHIYHPVVWILSGILALFLGIRFKQGLSRLRFHSLFFYWASVIHVAFLTSPLVTPSLKFFDQTWFFSLIATFIQFGFIIFFYKKGDIAPVSLPRPLLWLKDFIKMVDKRKNLWIYYPLFLSIALFLIWSFDASILTLLLSAECFLVFVISIILKENHFRYLSLAGLGLCMIRLAFYDLAASNILTKAIVCIGVGLLLIGMNALYNKFSERFKK